MAGTTKRWLWMAAIASVLSASLALESCLSKSALTGANFKYSCKDTEYCCATGCCTKIIALWYIWLIILASVIGICVFTCWYKKRKKRLLRVVPVPKLVPQGAVIAPVAPPPYNPGHFFADTSSSASYPPSYSTVPPADGPQVLQMQQLHVQQQQQPHQE